MKKKYLSLLVIVSLFFLSLSVSAETIENGKYVDNANQLKELGLFKGSNNGFELDRAPTRLEAGVMLIRLLGKEDEAIQNNYKHPFLDVPNWGSPYVGYMFKTGLTKGIKENQYGSNNLIDAKSYTTFVLRALGYSDKDGDFDWNAALTKGLEIGLLNQHDLSEFNKGKKFLRDDMVYFSYNALSKVLKNNQLTLVEKLVKEGVVEQQAAQKLSLINSKFIDISAGPFSALALKEDGTVWEIVETEIGPQKIDGLDNIIKVAAGSNHNVALAEDGTVWAWGSNDFGQLGDGNSEEKITPIKINELSNIKDISAGHEHSVALKEDGTVWVWGRIIDGQVTSHFIDEEDGNREYFNLNPVKYVGLSDVKAISAGSSHFVALKNDGTVWTVGNDFYAHDKGSIEKIQEMNDVIAIDAGNIFTVALRNDGTGWIWGFDYNLVGLEKEVFQDRFIVNKNPMIPIPVDTSSIIIDIAAGLDAAYIKKEDNTVWAWGANLGNKFDINKLDANGGIVFDVPSPTQLKIENYLKIDGGFNYTIILMADGTLKIIGSF